MARQLLEEAIAIDPKYARAYRYLAGTYQLDVWLGLSKSPKKSIAKAIELDKKAIALDDSLADAHGHLGYLYMMARQYEKAIIQGKHAVALAPNSAENLAWLGTILTFADEAEKAIPPLEKAIRLNPVDPSWYLHIISLAYLDAGRYEDAITAARKAVDLEPNNLIAHIALASAAGILGREDEARTAAAEILRISPKFSLERFAKIRPHKDPQNTASLVERLRKAGLK